MFERELSILDSDNLDERIAVVEVDDLLHGLRVELRFQQELNGLGWVTQRRITFDATQVTDLRLALTLFASQHPSRPAAPKLVALDDYRARIA